MKTFRNKKIFTVILALLALTIAVVIGHGCGVSSYPDTADTSTGTIIITKAGAAQVEKPAAQLTAKLADGTDVTTLVTWSSDPAGLVSIDSSGLVTALMAGSVTVKATMGGQTGTLTFTVYAKAGH